MQILKSEVFTLTFFTYVLLGSTFVEALSHSSPAVSRREHHLDLKKRFIKKRSPIPQQNKEDLGFDEIPVVGVGKAPETDTAVTTSESTSTSSSTSSSSSESTSSSSSVSESSSTASSTSSSSSSSSSVAPTSSASAPAPTPTETFIETPTTSHATVVIFSTAANAPSESAQVNLNQTGGASSSKSVILTALIAVAASIGGIVILWTIFRKWKLGRSKEFDQRLQPIDWQPTTADDGDDIIPPNRRHSGASSFRSGISPRNYGAATDVEYNKQPALQTLPDHDFTAGPSLAPVGGYADLSRGPSPQPQMSERTGNTGMSSYDASLPLHHQGYGSQDAYTGGRY